MPKPKHQSQPKSQPTPQPVAKAKPIVQATAETTKTPGKTPNKGQGPTAATPKASKQQEVKTTNPKPQKQKPGMTLAQKKGLDPTPAAAEKRKADRAKVQEQKEKTEQDAKKNKAAKKTTLPISKTTPQPVAKAKPIVQATAVTTKTPGKTPNKGQGPTAATPKESKQKTVGTTNPKQLTPAAAKRAEVQAQKEKKEQDAKKNKANRKKTKRIVQAAAAATTNKPGEIPNKGPGTAAKKPATVATPATPTVLAAGTSFAGQPNTRQNTVASQTKTQVPNSAPASNPAKRNTQEHQEAANISATATIMIEQSELQNQKEENKKKAANIPVTATIMIEQSGPQTAQKGDNKEKEKTEKVIESQINNPKLKQSDKKSATEIFNSMFQKDGKYKDGFKVETDATGKETFTFANEEERRKFAIAYANAHPGEPFTMRDDNNNVVFQSDGSVLREPKTHGFLKKTTTMDVVPTNAVAEISESKFENTSTKETEKATIFTSGLTKKDFDNTGALKSQREQFLDYAKKHPTEHFEVRSKSSIFSKQEVLFASDGKGNFYSLTEKDGAKKPYAEGLLDNTKAKALVAVQPSDMNAQLSSAKPNAAKKTGAQVQQQFNQVAATHAAKSSTIQETQGKATPPPKNPTI